MTVRKGSCSGVDAVGAEIDAEFRRVLDAMFCACLPGRESRESGLRRELFFRCDIEGRTLAEAALALGLDVREAEALLADTRRDVAVLMALGLYRPDGAETAVGASPAGCGCAVGARPSGAAQDRKQVDS